MSDPGKAAFAPAPDLFVPLSICLARSNVNLVTYIEVAITGLVSLFGIVYLTVPMLLSVRDICILKQKRRKPIHRPVATSV